jgi:Ulp1 family protease
MQASSGFFRTPALNAPVDQRTQIRQNYNTVKRWTKLVDLFKFRFLIVPICENSHWFMAIINRMDLVEAHMQEHIQKCYRKESFCEGPSKPQSPVV